MRLSDRVKHQGRTAPAEPATGDGAGEEASAPSEAQPPSGEQAPRTRKPTPSGAPRQDPMAVLKQRLQEQLFARLGSRLYDASMSEDQLLEFVNAELTGVVDEEQTPLSPQERRQLVADVSNDVLGYGPIQALLDDDDVTEIMVNSTDRIYVERAGRLHPTEARFLSEDHLRRIIERIVSEVGRRVDESSPMVDARLPDGSRVNAVIPPLAVDGPSLTVRKFARDPFTAEDLVAMGSMNQSIADLLRACVEGRLNVIVSGGTGTGKTTMLNVLSSYISDGERIVSVEDAVELQLQQPHVVRLESRPPNVEGRGEVTIRDLVRNALRMRPDRILVGEVRSGEALDMLQAMNTGHEGSLTTVHANSPRDALSRVETMVLMAGMDLPVRAIREQIASAIHVIVQIGRMRDGSRRITQITEVAGMEGGTITLQDIFTFDHAAGIDEDDRLRGTQQPTGIRPKFAEHLATHVHALPAELFGSADALLELR